MMSAVLAALESLAINFRSGIYRLTPESIAVLFYATPYWKARYNWLDKSVVGDSVSDVEWDTISAYVDGLLYEVKNPVIGLITAYMTESPPANILPCDGSTYLREDYPALYEALDTFYIVDADNFNVPDLRGRTIIGVGEGSGLSSRFTGDVGGEESHQLTESELASHNHSIELTTGVPGVAPGEVSFDVTVPLATDFTGVTGDDTPHNNMQPYYALNYGVIAS